MEIIEFNRTQQFVIGNKKTPRYKCNHSESTIDEQRRLMVCNKCNQHIEPFDFIMMIASDDIRIRDSIKALRAECNQVREEVEELKRQRRNLKAQINRANKDK